MMKYMLRGGGTGIQNETLAAAAVSSSSSSSSSLFLPAEHPALVPPPNLPPDEVRPVPLGARDDDDHKQFRHPSAVLEEAWRSFLHEAVSSGELELSTNKTVTFSGRNLHRVAQPHIPPPEFWDEDAAAEAGKEVPLPTYLEESKGGDVQRRNRLEVTRSQHRPVLQLDWTFGRAVAWHYTSTLGIHYLRWLDSDLTGANINGFWNQEVWIPIPETSADSPARGIRTRIYRRNGSDNRVVPAILYAHGGGMVAGRPEVNFRFFRGLLTRRDVCIIAPSYRVAPEDPYPAAHDDLYGVLQYMHSHGDELKIRTDRYILAGHSAGAGLVAGMVIRNRNEGWPFPIAFQMPIYPMLDHRFITPSSRMYGSMFWDFPAGENCWQQYLSRYGPGADIPQYASPIQNGDHNGWPPTISFVGELEPFRDEVGNYIATLNNAGVHTRFRLFDGAYHGFNEFNILAEVSVEANQFMYTAFEDFFDLYMA